MDTNICPFCKQHAHCVFIKQHIRVHESYTVSSVTGTCILVTFSGWCCFGEVFAIASFPFMSQFALQFRRHFCCLHLYFMMRVGLCWASAYFRLTMQSQERKETRIFFCWLLSKVSMFCFYYLYFFNINIASDKTIIFYFF